MNRLIIVGNGFDRYHGLNSDYRSFIIDYLYNSIRSFHTLDVPKVDDGLILIERYKTNTVRVPDTYSDKEKVFDTIKDFRTGRYNLKFVCKSDFIKEICQDAEYNWVDIERAYYKHLIREFKHIQDKDDIEDKDLDGIRELNLQMEVIAEKLEEYLKNESETKYKQASLDYDFILSPFSEREFEAGVWKKIPKKDNNPKCPEKAVILNFNYTNPFRLQRDLVDVINIHGYLKNSEYPIVFGYGDERDEAYKELEKAGKDELLKHIKSFAYFQNSAYNRLLGFIESGDFEVWVVGHSCGLSDKTLLAQIFEHDFCKNIRVYKYEDKDGNPHENYNEIVYNIARVMSDKIKMRSIVSHKYGANEFSNVSGIIDNFRE